MVMTFNESQIDKIADKEFKGIIVCYKNSNANFECFLGEYKLIAEWNKEVNKICQIVFNKGTASVMVTRMWIISHWSFLKE